MNFYETELNALKKVNRYRTRQLYDNSLLDFASNDYLGLSHKKELHQKSVQTLDSLEFHSTKASLMVNGYHQIHKNFQERLCEINNFEDAVLLGSGFNANIALIEALVRKKDTLFMDEKYHASGVLAANLKGINVIYFKHNDMQELETLLNNATAKRCIVAVEGIYSMDGDLCNKDVFELCDRYNALLIVDEAHSSGVIGKKLMGVFDYYDIEIKANYIKMGTLGKAYGSFGAYILASKHIIEYLLNRAKPIIYATSLSLYDTLLGHNALEYIIQNRQELKREIAQQQQIVFEELGIKIDALILPIVINDNAKVLSIKEELQHQGYSVGAIRQPTVERAIIRVIARLGSPKQTLRDLCKKIATFR